MRVYFDSKAIIRALVRHIRSSERIYGCIAWVTHPKLLDEFEKIPTELIMTKHKSNKWKRHIKVKFVGSGRGRKSEYYYSRTIRTTRVARTYLVVEEIKNDEDTLSRSLIIHSYA